MLGNKFSLTFWKSIYFVSLENGTFNKENKNYKKKTIS